LILAVFYTSYGFILGRNKNQNKYNFKKEKFLKESLRPFITSTASHFEKRPVSGTLLAGGYAVYLWCFIMGNLVRKKSLA
jgi:uncharacterized BrkB/YihY/UPF0761 family membrane protein